MIVGKGDLAKVIKDRPGFCFFASGVSNSSEIKESEYQREKDLLLKQQKDLHIVYFSSLSVFYGNSRYVEHKKQMEELVQGFPSYTIVRLGNITWGDNPHTLINYLRAHPKAEIRDEWRYICDKDEFLHWMELIPDWNCEMNIPGIRMKVKDVYDKYIL
jgi:hypothetical protein